MRVLLHICRSGFGTIKTGESAYNMALMREIDKAYIKWPFLGVRQMRRYLVNLGYPVGNKRVRRLMRVMGIMAIYPKPRTSILDPENRSYPYLLRGINGMPMFIFIEKKGEKSFHFICADNDIEIAERQLTGFGAV